jgi:hypothetical protein
VRLVLCGGRDPDDVRWKGIAPVSYFVANVEEGAVWRIDREDLAPAIRRDWPGGSVERIDDPRRNYSLEWEVGTDGGPVTGMLDSRGDAIVLDGEIDDCATSARWFRSVTPEDWRLQWFDEAYTGAIDLTRDTTTQQLVDAIPD